ncbi:hypothetical protein EDD21DRAFT_118755 [Dissophora ornata]|nr:hypothetical protein EDD21DRAFT_118755 [Dissophora ornata]
MQISKQALKTACQLAELHPSRPILVVLEDDIRASFMERVVQWMQKILATQMQRLWAQEAMRAVPTSLQKGVPIATKDTNAPLHELCEAVFDKTQPMDLSWLPDNVFIGCGLCASKILINKPIMNQNVATIPPHRPLRRFSSSRSDLPGNLTINTAPLKPAETLGVEVIAAKGHKDKRYQLFTENGLVFAGDKHPLIRSLDSKTTPPSSRDGAGRRRTSSMSYEELSGSSEMMFSISIKHLRPRDCAIGGKQFIHWPKAVYQQLLASASHLLDRFSRKGVESQSLPAQNNPNTDIRPVLLHQSYRVVHNGRVWPRTLDDDTKETFSLEISASTMSLKVEAPVQVQVKVVTGPRAQEAFGNSEMIRKGEAVLMEGLVMAREIARTAGWICLEEDDCQMVEWVRDQMSLQWMNNSPLVAPIQPVCSTLEGLRTVLRSRAPSGGSLKVRTPTLSPYTSRTHSYHGPRRGDLGFGEKRDSTLDRLREVSENLETHEKKTGIERIERDDPVSAPKVTTEAVEGRAPLKPGLKTSFGGFSSLSDTRSQTLALAEATEDHLGMALSIGTTAGGLSSPEEHRQQDQNSRSFGEGVDPLDVLDTNNTKSSSPDAPRKLSRFSIKNYQLERSNHGLSDKWSIGVSDVNPSGVISSPPPPVLVSDLLSTPPLVADGGLSGTISPLTPRPQDIPVADFLQSLDAISADGRRPSHQADRSQYNIFGNGGGNGGRDDPLPGDALSHSDKNLMDNSNRKGTGTFSLVRNGSINGGGSAGKALLCSRWTTESVSNNTIN